MIVNLVLQSIAELSPASLSSNDFIAIHQMNQEL